MWRATAGSGSVVFAGVGGLRGSPSLSRFARLLVVSKNNNNTKHKTNAAVLLYHLPVGLES
jgi:hypothetical protein